MQLAPFVPSIDVGDLKNGLKPLWMTIHDLSRFNMYRAVTYALNIGSLGAVLLLILKLRENVSGWIGLYCGVVILGKFAIVGRQLSLEALTGLIFGVLLVLLLQKLHRNRLAWAGSLFVLSAFIADEIRPDLSQTMAFHEFNWIPFSGQMGDNVAGIASMLEGIWPFAVMGFFAIIHESSGRKIHALPTGAVLALLVFALEYYQSFIIGRYPDITPVILATIGWSLPWLVKSDS